MLTQWIAPLFLALLLFAPQTARSDILDYYMTAVLPTLKGHKNINTDVYVSGEYTLLAWNDLGMHCVDGNDYSVFSILPPYNNLHAQLKRKNGDLVASGVTLTYQAQASAEGIFNTTSLYDRRGHAKTNFWQYVQPLFGAALPGDTGLTGVKMQTKSPQPLQYNPAHGWWEAEGLPITPVDDNGAKNFYPRVRVVARDMAGTLLAEAITVLPVSDEMDCRACHGSTGGYADARPRAGWVNDTDPLKDYKRNILRLHDDKHPDAVSENRSALSAKGYDYNASGLEATQTGGTPILCAACHRSNALPGTGIDGIRPLTQALHGQHAQVKDPVSGQTLNAVANRDACYRCHPGQATQCLRGAMGDARNSNGTAAMDCQYGPGRLGAARRVVRRAELPGMPPGGAAFPQRPDRGGDAACRRGHPFRDDPRHPGGGLQPLPLQPRPRRPAMRIVPRGDPCDLPDPRGG